MARKVFFSFHYVPDCWRAAMVRNIGVLEGNTPAKDNDWETVKRGGDDAIKKWIAAQMAGRSCTVVLVGAETAGRQWINHEIVKSWDDKLGVVGIRIHGLKDAESRIAKFGANPFDSITHGGTQKPLSKIVRCYDPKGSNSQERYDWIKTYLSDAVEEAIDIRAKNS